MGLSFRDEALLYFYHGEGESLLGGSSHFGASLERVRMFSARGRKVRESEITAWPTHGRPYEAHEPNLTKLDLFGKAARRMRRLQEINPLYVSVLACYYGDSGSRWSRAPKIGRIGSIIHLTEEGAKLIKKWRGRPTVATKLGEAKTAENAIFGAAGAGREAAIHRCVMAAYALHEEACRAFSGEGAPCAQAAE